ncbi:MAG TPA: FAD-dependent oxidoreductase [Vicinamibacteria bacterium]|nr:FAD-dependent oxidoreductase [Vicinamibacteria bacterium]
MRRLACDAVVVGAGFAGAATAYHLVRMGLRDVVVLEQEPLPGTHASGRNAGMIREAVLPEAIQPLAVEGARFVRDPPADLDPVPSFRRSGALMLAEGAQAKAVRAWVESAERWGVRARWLDQSEAEGRVPALRGAAFSGAAWCPDDGVVDIAALLQGYLQTAVRGGARVLTGQRVLGIAVEKGKVSGVATDQASFTTPLVVNAAGAWAGEVGKLAGATPVPLRACRRHLYVSGRLDWVEPSWPIVWDLSHALYFRPEPPGLLLSACDETEQAPGLAATDAAASEMLAGKLSRYVKRLADLPIARSWAGLRTLTPDGGFVLGRDPQIAGFVWCAGLGGHGVTVGPAVGRLAAEAALGRPQPAAHSPARFVAPALPASDRDALVGEP